MSSIKQVRAQVFKTEFYQAWVEVCNPLPYSGVSTDFVSQGEQWMVPRRENGVFSDYDFDFAPTAPTTDSVRVVRLKNENTQETIWILGTESDWLERINGCCGETPVMPQITYVDPVSIETPCCQTEPVDPADCFYPYQAVAPALIDGQALVLSGSCGGTPFTPTAPADGFATPALALAWAQANWGAYGTFTAITNDESETIGLRLESETCKTGLLNLTLLVQSFCMDITSQVGEDFNAIEHNGEVFPLGFTAQVGQQAQTTIDIIESFFADGTLTAPDQDKINYTGTGVPVSIGNLVGDDYTPLLSFSEGACEEDS